MEIFLDTADINVIKKYKNFIDGVTTNPSLIAAINGSTTYKIIEEICDVISGPISVEVISNTVDEMFVEGKELAKIHSNVCVKLPCTFEGLQVCKQLSQKGISTNLTLCFSSTQALLAAKCGATYVSPFIGRIDDIGQDGMGLIDEIVNIYDVQKIETKVLAASIRNVNHVIQAAYIGADAITLPEKVLSQCFYHPLTKSGLKKFMQDWNNKDQKDNS